MTDALLVAVGFVLLFVGAELLVRGASRLGAMMGVSSLVIGLTIVAFGTSAPELAVSVLSARRGESGIAVGNVVGSNIFNVLVVLGISALVRPLTIEHRVIWREVPVMVGVSLLGAALAWDGVVGRVDGALLSLGLVVFLYGMKASAGVGDGDDAAMGSVRRGLSAILTQGLVVAAGLALLVFGARLLVDGATGMARAFGVPELVIGLTLVAAGTSLPELATSAVAALRGERDIAVGNVVGSNVFNLLGVLGISSFLARAPVTVPRSSLLFDFPVMIAAAILCFVFFRTGRRLSRWEGAVFLVSYVIYLGLLFRAAGSPPG